MNKIYEPGQCMKYMNIEIHPTLMSKWFMSDVQHEVSLVKASVVPAPDLFAPELLVWTRNIPRTLESNADDGQVQLSAATSACERALYISAAEELGDAIAAHSLAAQLQEIQQVVDCQLTLVLFGTKDYFKGTRRKTNYSNRAKYTEIDLEMAIADLLISAGCDTAQVNTPNELALLITQFTKSIAEAPYRKLKHSIDEQAGVYLRGDNKKCVAIKNMPSSESESRAEDFFGLWQQMIAVLPHSSLETSRAICAQYKTPLDLVDAFPDADSVTALSQLGVARSAAPGARARCVGGELARRLHALFTATDGDVLLH